MRNPTARLITAALLVMAPISGNAAGTSAEREITDIFAKFVDPGDPGCTCGVSQNGTLTHALAFGLADLERGKPLDTHSIVNLASVTKQFTAFALLLLQQQGKLSLDDPLVRYVPELAASAKGVTLRHLMHHTGGLRDYIQIIYMGGRKDSDGSTIHESVQALARQTRPNFQPGAEYVYSNTGYMLLGVVIARVSGQSLAKFSEERIFRPLSMKNTSIVDSYPDGIAALARGYAKTDKGFVIDETAWEQVGDGQVHSDLHDLALWDENFYTARLGGREVIDQMVKVGVLNSGEPIDYAAGLLVSESRGIRWVSHGGSWVGYRSHLLRVPDEHLSVIVLCNRGDAAAGELAMSVAEVFVEDKLGPPEAEADEEEMKEKMAPTWKPRDLGRYAGVYFSAEANAHCRLYEIGAALVVEGCAEGAILKPGKPGEFVDEDESFSLSFPDDDAQVDRFVYDTSDLRGLPFERVKESPK